VPKLSLSVERGEQRYGETLNDVVTLSNAVMIRDFERVESHGSGGLTLFKHLGQLKVWFPCKQCKILLPEGIHICWNVKCLRPVTNQGFQDLMRVYSMQGNVDLMDRLFANLDVAVSNAHVRRMTAMSQGRDPRGPDGDQQTIHNWSEKQMTKAKRALKLPHAGLVDPADPTRWIVFPKSRNYYSHTERYQVEEVYRQQCNESGASNDGHLWFRGANADGKFVYLDAVRIVAEKQAGNNPQNQRGSRDSQSSSSQRGRYTNVALAKPKASPGEGRARRGDNMKRDYPVATREATGGWDSQSWNSSWKPSSSASSSRDGWTDWQEDSR